MKKSKGLWLGSLTALGAAASLGRFFYDKQRNSDKKTYGIICAMESEVAPLREAMDINRTKEISGLIFYQGMIGRQRVVLVQCGVGKVNAALCAEVLCTCFDVDILINTGVAGTPDPQVRQGDIVISTQAVHHDMDATPLGFAKGEVPDMDMIYFQADNDLVAKARSAAETSDIGDARVFEGTIASGDQFIAGEEQTAPIVKNFAPKAVEMEGAAIAHVAWANKVPFVIIRSISDNADGGAPLSYPEFLPIAARNSCAVVAAMLAMD